MAILLLIGRDQHESQRLDWFTANWKQTLLTLDKTLDIRVWPEIGDTHEIEAVFVWRHPLGVLKQFPHLKCIASLAAGVDHLFADPDLPKSVPIIRVMDSYMANDIVQYVLASVLIYVKRMDHWAANQAQHIWERQPPFNYSDKTIGIMGLGFLGEKVALTLTQIGLNVIGWSNSHKQLKNIKSFAGSAELDHFLTQTDILICILPLTPQTQGILNAETLSKLRKGSFLINLARGEHLIDQDLLRSLDYGQLEGACLDVFHREPLPADHPFWTHPKVRITPHIASVTNHKTAAPLVLEDYRMILAGKRPISQIDVDKGY